VTLTTLLSCAVQREASPAFDIARRPTSPLSTRTDFRSRLDRGVTIVARATCIRRAATPSPPSLEDCSSGGHILFLLLMVISRSYYLSLADIFSSGYFIPFFICDLRIRCLRTHSLCAFAITQCSSCFSWGRVQRVSWGAYRESPFYFLSLPLYVEGTSLTTSLRYQDAVLAASYIYA
jgi:hypothetical protein